MELRDQMELRNQTELLSQTELRDQVSEVCIPGAVAGAPVHEPPSCYRMDICSDCLDEGCNHVVRMCCGHEACAKCGIAMYTRRMHACPVCRRKDALRDLFVVMCDELDPVIVDRLFHFAHSRESFALIRFPCMLIYLPPPTLVEPEVVVRVGATPTTEEVAVRVLPPTPPGDEDPTAASRHSVTINITSHFHARRQENLLGMLRTLVAITFLVFVTTFVVHFYADYLGIRD